MNISRKKVYFSLAVFSAVFLLSGCGNSSTTGQQNKSINSTNVQQLQQQPTGNNATQAQRAPAVTSCGEDYYRNVDGVCVHRPSSSVCEGATAKCRDNTCSFSQHRQGTCSGHGGVAQWL